jgi:hypothetical protein
MAEEKASSEGSRDDTEVSWESADDLLSEPHLIESNEDKDEEEVESSPKPKSKTKWNSRNSFTADSPYFTAFCESEVESLGLLTDTMRDITNRTRTFSKAGALMSEATRRLSQSCKLRQDVGTGEDQENRAEIRENMAQRRRKAVGEEMTALLEHLGEVRCMRSLHLPAYPNLLLGSLFFSFIGFRRNG